MHRKIEIENLKPVSDRVVIMPDEQEKQTESGILLPKETIRANTIMTGKVVAVGNGKPGQKMFVKKGDIVMFPKNSGTTISGGLIIINEPTILSVI